MRTATKTLTAALKRKYAKTLWLVDRERADPADLAHLAAVIRMFDPGADLSSIRPSKTYRATKRATKGKRHDLLAVDILRTVGEPMTAHEIAVRVAFLTSAPDPKRAAYSISGSFPRTLSKFEGVRVIEGRPRRWAAVRINSTDCTLG